MTALWPLRKVLIQDVKPEWEFTSDELDIIKKFSGRIFGWETVERDELLGSNNILHLERKEVVAEVANVNENEGFACWFD
jgi:hypothetical protein